MGNRSTGAIRRSIANQKGVIDGIDARITSLNGRIERLETARGSVDGIYQDTCTMVDNMAAYDVGIAWRGNPREDWEDLKGDAVEMGKTYRNAINDIYLAIDAKIASLSNQLTEEKTGLAVANETLRILNNELLVANWRKGLPELRKKANSCPRKYR